MSFINTFSTNKHQFFDKINNEYLNLDIKTPNTVQKNNDDLMKHI